MQRIAVIGSGISGLAAAARLASAQPSHQVCLLEAGSHFGGHANTVDLSLDGITHGVDTGFLVFNHRTYPLLTQLFQDLDVDTVASEMSFSVQVPGADGRNALEWSGCSLDTVFAAAAATSAFGVFYASVWNMADTLSLVRLALINVVAIATLICWLIFHNGLWERSWARGGRSTQPRLYNATTVLTLSVGVACMYALLFCAVLLASLAVISSEYLEATLQHSVDVKDYIRIAWFASSMGTVAGALGSNFESETAVRHAAYGRRQRERLD